MDKESLQIKSNKDIDIIYGVNRVWIGNLNEKFFSSVINHNVVIYNFIHFRELVYLCYLDFIKIKTKEREEIKKDMSYLQEPHDVYKHLYIFYFKKYLTELIINCDTPEEKFANSCILNILPTSTFKDSKNILSLLFLKNLIISLKDLVPKSSLNSFKQKVDNLSLSSSKINIFLTEFISTLI